VTSLFDVLPQSLWALQVIFHDLSILGSVPVRLINREKIFKGLPDLNGWNVASSEEMVTFLRTVPIKLVEHFTRRENSPWITRASNVHPLVEYLRNNSHWLAWEHCLVGHWLQNASREGLPLLLTRDYFRREMRMAAWPLRVTDQLDGFLVTGPLFMPADRNSAEDFYETRTSVFIEGVLRGFIEAGIATQFEAAAMHKLAATRDWVRGSLLESKTIMLGNVCQCLANMQVKKSRKPPTLSRSTFNSMVRIAYMLHIEHVIEKVRHEPRGDGTIISFRIPHRNNQFLMKAMWGQGRWNLTLEQEQGSCLTQPTVEVEHKTCSGFMEECALERLLDEVDSSYAMLQHSYANELLIRLETWMKTSFGIVASHGHGLRLEPRAFDMQYRMLCTKMRTLLTADVSAIYFYDHAQGRLIPKVLDCEGKLDELERERLLKSLTGFMETVAKQEDRRDRSIAYRAADTVSPRFCRAYHEDAEKIDPQGEGMLKWNEPFKDCLASMALPLTVNGRVFGVLEIGGKVAHQFRYEDLVLAEHVANVMGEFLYQKEVWTTIAWLSEVALDLGRTDEEKYRYICKGFAQTFLADASSIFIRLHGKPDRYVQEAWYNRPDLDSQIKNGIEKLCLHKEIRDSPSVAAFESQGDRAFMHFDMIEHERHFPEYKQRLPQRQGVGTEYRHLVVIPVRHAETGEIRCSVSLYFKQSQTGPSPCPLTSHWEPTARFMAHYAALLVTAIQSRRLADEQVRNMLQHELKQIVGSISNLGMAIIDEVRKEMPGRIKESMEFKCRALESMNDVMNRLLYKVQGVQRGEVDERERSEFPDGPSDRIFGKGCGSDELVDLRDLCRNVSSALQSGIAKKGVSYEYIGPKVGPVGKLDPVLLHRIVQNLFGNAEKYALRNSKITVQIEITRRLVKLSISNDAKALANNQEKYFLFLPGFRGTNSNSEEGDGAGLAYAQLWANQLGGSLAVEVVPVEPGVSRFVFALSFPKRLFDASLMGKE
jgi:signal transduction histidine kinase